MGVLNKQNTVADPQNIRKIAEKHPEIEFEVVVLPPVKVDEVAEEEEVVEAEIVEWEEVQEGVKAAEILAEGGRVVAEVSAVLAVSVIRISAAALLISVRILHGISAWAWRKATRKATRNRSGRGMAPRHYRAMKARQAACGNFADVNVVAGGDVTVSIYQNQ